MLVTATTASSDSIYYSLDGGLKTSMDFSKEVGKGIIKISAEAAGCVIDSIIVINDVVSPCYKRSAWGPTVSTGPTGAFNLARLIMACFSTSINSSPFTYNYYYAGIAAGNYHVSVKDAVGCMWDTTVTVPAPVVYKTVGRSQQNKSTLLAFFRPAK